LTNSVFGHNSGATKQTGETDHNGNAGGKSVWWTWTAPANVTVVVDTIGSSFDTLLAVYTGSTVSALTFIASDDDSGGNHTSRLTFGAISNTTYQIAVDGYTGFLGSAASGFIALNLRGIPKPANDAFVKRFLIEGQTNIVTGHNFGATLEPGEPSQAGYTGGKSVWWTWTAPTNGNVSLDANGSDFSVIVAVYRGNVVSNLVAVGSAAYGGKLFLGEAGSTYQIAVDGNSGNGGNIRLRLEQAPPAAPEFASQPLGEIVKTRQPVYFVPAVVGTIPVRFQWFKDGRSIIGATNYYHQIDSAQVDDTGTYSLMASNAYGTALSSNAVLAVLAPPLNDDFTNSILLTGLSNRVFVANGGATREFDEPFHAGNTGGASAWWNWTAPTNGLAVVDTSGSSFDTTLAVYTGTNIADLAGVGANDNTGSGRTSQLSFDALAGRTYRIAVDGYDGATGSIVLNLQLWPRPPNDDLANASVLTGVTTVVQANNSGATKEPGEPVYYDDSGASLWWSWTAPADGAAVADTLGSSIDTALAVYTGTGYSDLNLVDRHDNGGGSLRFACAVGTTYRIAVDGKAGSRGAVTLRLRFLPSPVNDHFTNRTVFAGISNTVSGNFQGASKEPDEFYTGGIGVSVWWSWVAPSNGVVKLESLGSGFPTYLDVYTGNSLTNLVQRSVGYDWVTFEASAGSSYQIRLGSDGVVGFGGSYLLSLHQLPPPLNDAFSNRIRLIGTPAVVTGDTLGATFEPGEPGHGTARRSAWWSWTAPRNGSVRIADKGSSPAARIDVYSGASLPALTNVGNPFAALAGTEYQIAVTGDYGTYGGYFGATALEFKLLNWDVVDLQKSLNGLTTSFQVVLSLSSSEPGSTSFRFRLVARPGYSRTLNGSRVLPADLWIGTNVVDLAGMAGSITNITMTGICPAPNPPSDQNFAVGWAVFVLLDQRVETNWVVRDNGPLLTGQWPAVSGFNGPGGGVTRFDPDLNSPAFSPLTVSTVVISGPTGMDEATPGSFYASAVYQNGLVDTFTNGAWKSSALGITNGLFTSGGVTSNTPVTLSVVYSSFGLDYVGSTQITVTNLPSPRISAARGTNVDSLNITLSGVPGRNHLIEAATNLVPPLVWTPFATNRTDGSGKANFLEPARNAFQQRYYRAKELP